MNGADVVGVATEERRLGEVVQAARKHAGMTQQELCHRSGLSYSTLAKIERGAIKAPSVFTIQHIAATLDIGLEELLGSVPTPPAAGKRVSKSGVRFVYFDMNGCLVRAATTKAFTKLAEESGVSPEVIETIYWQFNNDVCRGTAGIDTLNAAMSDRLDLKVDWNKYYLEAVEATPGVADLVRWTADNYKVGILTNAMPGQVKSMLQNGTLPKVQYSQIIDSSELAVLKPEPRMFELAAEKAGVRPSELLLIDDDRTNLASAGQLGWHTISFDAYHPEVSIVSVSTALQPAD